MRKMVLKKCLYFISFYKVHALCWIKNFFFIFFLWYAFVFTRICLHKAQNNMVSALKSKPETKNWDGKTANNELSEHKTSHVSLTPYYLTTCEAPFKFVLAISQATDPSTTIFFFIFHCSTYVPEGTVAEKIVVEGIIVEVFFLQLLFPHRTSKIRCTLVSVHLPCT